MFDVVNGLERFVQHAKIVVGRATVTGGNTITLSSLSGGLLNDQLNVSAAYTGTGAYTFTITNFSGPAGLVAAFGCATTAPLLVDHTAPSYSGDTLTIEFLLTSAGSATDDNFDFLILAF